MGILTLKNPILGRYAETTGNLVDRYTRVGSIVVANELIGGLPFTDIASADYNATEEKLTIYLKGYGFLWIIAIVAIAVAIAWSVTMWTNMEIQKEQYQTERTRMIEETNRQYIDYMNAVREDLANGSITESEASLLANAPAELVSSRTPPPFPAWIWAIVAIILILVIAFIAYKVVAPAIRRRF